MIVGVRAEARRPLWICKMAIATSRAFSSAIIAEHSDWYEEKWNGQLYQKWNKIKKYATLKVMVIYEQMSSTIWSKLSIVVFRYEDDPF
jgi:hypothetical protein